VGSAAFGVAGLHPITLCFIVSNFPVVVTTASTILVVDDCEDDCILLEQAFLKANIRNPLLMMRDAHEAVRYLAGQDRYANRGAHPLPALILLDLQLSGMDGYSFLRWMREDPALDMIPVVVLTGARSDSAIGRAYAFGANSFLVKPGTFEELVVMVEALSAYWIRLAAIPAVNGAAWKRPERRV